MKKSILTIASASAFLLLAGCSNGQANQQSGTTQATAQSGNDIAKVGDSTITFDEFYTELKTIAGESTLRNMIIERILEQNVEDAEGLKASANEEVDAQITSAGGEEVFAQLLAYQNLGTVEDFRNSVYIRNLFQAVIKSNVDLSDEALKNYYENDYSPLMEAQHILVDTEEEANAVLERLSAGEEFDALAQELSKDSSGANGGLLGQFSSGQMVPEFEEAVKSVGNGELVSEPVESQYGFHVIRTINNGEKKPYDEISEEVKEAYLESKYNDSSVAYSIIGGLIKENGVEIFDEDLKSTVDDLLAAIDAAEAGANQVTESAESPDASESTEEASEEAEETSDSDEVVEEETEETTESAE